MEKVGENHLWVPFEEKKEGQIINSIFQKNNNQTFKNVRYIFNHHYYGKTLLISKKKTSHIQTYLLGDQ